MNKLNCPNCKRRRKFSITEQEKYECETCNQKFKQCMNKECLNLINHGIICKKCIGKGIKNGGAVAAAGLVAIGSVAFKYLRKEK